MSLGLSLSKMSRKAWIAALRARLGDREELDVDQLFARAWASRGLSRDQVREALALIEAEYGLPAGILRPEDSLEVLFQPVQTSNPWHRLQYRFWAGDKRIELDRQVSRRLARYGTEGAWAKIRTIDDFIRAWCGGAPG